MFQESFTSIQTEQLCLYHHIHSTSLTGEVNLNFVFFQMWRNILFELCEVSQTVEPVSKPRS